MGRKSEAQKKKEKQTKMIIDWQQEHTTRLCLRFSNEKEADILKKLDSVESKKNYIVGLIRDDMKKED